MKPIPKWKMAVMIWLGIYPIITTLILLLFPFMQAHDWPFPPRTLVLTLLAVPLMVFVAMPVLQKLLGKWLIK
jgi:antibiotic biosynthesis monooxygenase (ABM) superfamily enzyme